MLLSYTVPVRGYYTAGDLPESEAEVTCADVVTNLWLETHTQMEITRYEEIN